VVPLDDALRFELGFALRFVPHDKVVPQEISCSRCVVAAEGDLREWHLYNFRTRLRRLLEMGTQLFDCLTRGFVIDRCGITAICEKDYQEESRRLPKPHGLVLLTACNWV
jgi:hypothetical protein